MFMRLLLLTQSLTDPSPISQFTVEVNKESLQSVHISDCKQDSVVTNFYR